MPLVNDYVQLYFSNEYEEPTVIFCVRKNGDTCEKFKNVNKRYYATESGDNLEVFPDSINIYRKELSVKLNDINGVEIKSSGKLSVGAGNRIHLFAKNVNINAESKILIQKNKVSEMTLEGDLYTQTIGVVRENGRY